MRIKIVFNNRKITTKMFSVTEKKYFSTTKNEIEIFFDNRNFLKT